MALFSGDAALDSEDLKEIKQKPERIKLLTIHSSKGLEFDFVFLPFWVDGQLPIRSEYRSE